MANRSRSMKSNQKKQKNISKKIFRVILGLAAILILGAGWWIINFNQTKTEAASSVEDVAPVSSGAASAERKPYAQAPEMQIDPEKTYFATVSMEKGGEFKIQLFADKAPITVNSFVFLAREGYFDGLTFHRVLKDFMAQGGDPTGSGSGGPGYQFVNEDNDLAFDKAGVVAMANAGRNTNGSQFFITFGPQEYLNGGYTIFGQVIEGMDVVNGLTLRNPELNPEFSGDVMQSVLITEE